VSSSSECSPSGSACKSVAGSWGSLSAQCVVWSVHYRFCVVSIQVFESNRHHGLFCRVQFVAVSLLQVVMVTVGELLHQMQSPLGFSGCCNCNWTSYAARNPQRPCWGCIHLRTHPTAPLRVKPCAGQRIGGDACVG
jgi:hypothetical protein